MARGALQEVEQAITHCRRSIERVRAEIDRRRQVGHDYAHAEERLRTIKQILRAHEADRDRLADEPEP